MKIFKFAVLGAAFLAATAWTPLLDGKTGLMGESDLTITNEPSQDAIMAIFSAGVGTWNGTGRSRTPQAGWQNWAGTRSCTMDGEALNCAFILGGTPAYTTSQTYRDGVMTTAFTFPNGAEQVLETKIAALNVEDEQNWWFKGMTLVEGQGARYEVMEKTIFMGGTVVATTAMRPAGSDTPWGYVSFVQATKAE